MEEQKPKRSRGCLFYGCISGSILLVLVLVGALIGLQLFKKMLNQFTENHALPLPAITLSQPEIEQLKQRVDTFRRELETNKTTTPLSLTTEEINALIQSNPELKDKLRVYVEGDKLKAQLSVLMQQLGLPVFKDRYLNATATLGLALDNGNLSLNLHDVMVKGKALPEVYQDRIRTANLLQGLQTDTRLNAAMSRLQEINVKDGRLVIVPKSTP